MPFLATFGILYNMLLLYIYKGPPFVFLMICTPPFGQDTNFLVFVNHLVF